MGYFPRYKLSQMVNPYDNFSDLEIHQHSRLAIAPVGLVPQFIVIPYTYTLEK